MKLRKERSENGSFFRKRKVSGKKKIVIGTAVVLTVSVAAGGVYWRYQSGKRPSAPEKTVQATKATAEISVHIKYNRGNGKSGSRHSGFPEDSLRNHYFRGKGRKRRSRFQRGCAGRSRFFFCL